MKRSHILPRRCAATAAGAGLLASPYANRASLGADPHYQAVARSQIDLTGGLQLDSALRGVDDLGASGLGRYDEGDARPAWRVSEPIELYVAGADLLHRSHVESNDSGRAQRIERGVYIGTRLRS